MAPLTCQILECQGASGHLTILFISHSAQKYINKEPITAIFVLGVKMSPNFPHFEKDLFALKPLPIFKFFR